MINHLKHLRTLRFSEQVAYLSRKTVGVLGKVTSRLRHPSVAWSPPDAGRTMADFEDIGMINHMARRHYQPRHYPGRLVLFRAEQVPNWIGSRFDDPLMGWGDLAVGGIEVQTVPGDHLTLLNRRNAGSLARQLNTYLEQ
jgi:thioesterase domain-containing protein